MLEHPTRRSQLRFRTNVPFNCANLQGRRFGSLMAVKIAETYLDTTYWLCRCDCGADVRVSRRKLISGATYSCGKPGCIYRAMLTDQKWRAE